MPTVTIRSGSIVNTGVIEFANPVDLQPGDLVAKKSLRAVTVTQAAGINGMPKQPAPVPTPLPVQFSRLDADSKRFRLSLFLPVDSVFGLFYRGEEIKTFHQLFGDLDRDGSVGAADVDACVASLDKAEGAEGYQAGMDLDGSGFVDTLDFYQAERQLRAGTTWAYSS
jgi:hypothetical protein